MTRISLLLLLSAFLTQFSFGQKEKGPSKTQNRIVIADTEKKFLYREYKNVIEYSGNDKMDSIWIEADSCEIIQRKDFNNMSTVIPKMKRNTIIEIVLKGKKKKKTFELGRERFLVFDVPNPFLCIGNNRIDGDFNELPDEEAFGNNRMFLKIDHTVLVNVTCQIKEIGITVGNEFLSTGHGVLPDRILNKIKSAPAGTLITFEYFDYTGTGHEKKERVNMNIIYRKKSGPEVFLEEQEE